MTGRHINNKLQRIKIIPNARNHPQLPADSFFKSNAKVIKLTPLNKIQNAATYERTAILNPGLIIR